MDTTTTSSFNFRKVKVFEPLKVLRVGVPVFTLALYGAIWLRGWFSLGLIPVMLALYVFMHRRTLSMPLCMSVRLHGPVVGDLYHGEGFIFGDVSVGYSVVGQLGSNLKLHKLAYAPGYAVERKIPLAGVKDGWNIRWNHGQTTLHLSEDEIPGALHAVAKGDNLMIELLIGNVRGEGSNTMGVKIQSDKGSLESWSPKLKAQTIGLGESESP